MLLNAQQRAAIYTIREAKEDIYVYAPRQTGKTTTAVTYIKELSSDASSVLIVPNRTMQRYVENMAPGLFGPTFSSRRILAWGERAMSTFYEDVICKAHGQTHKPKRHLIIDDTIIGKEDEASLLSLCGIYDFKVLRFHSMQMSEAKNWTLKGKNTLVEILKTGVVNNLRGLPAVEVEKVKTFSRTFKFLDLEI